MTAPRGSAPTEMEIPDFVLRTPQAAPDITARRNHGHSMPPELRWLHRDRSGT